MQKVDVSTWKRSVRERRYTSYTKKVPVYSIFEVLFFVNRCNHCEGDERGVCKHWCRTNYCTMIHQYCPVSLIHGNFIEKVDPNVSDIQTSELPRLGPPPSKPKYYRPDAVEIAKAKSLPPGSRVSKIRIKPNGFRIRY